MISSIKVEHLAHDEEQLDDLPEGVVKARFFQLSLKATACLIKTVDDWQIARVFCGERPPKARAKAAYDLCIREFKRRQEGVEDSAALDFYEDLLSDLFNDLTLLHNDMAIAQATDIDPSVMLDAVKERLSALIQEYDGE